MTSLEGVSGRPRSLTDTTKTYIQPAFLLVGQTLPLSNATQPPTTYPSVILNCATESAFPSSRGLPIPCAYTFLASNLLQPLPAWTALAALAGRRFF